jgi:hypothetical protein
VTALGSLIDASSPPDERALELALFGTSDAEAIAELLAGFVEGHAEAVVGAVFYTASVGIVAGLRLASGAEAVLKVHRWGVSSERLAAVQVVQEAVARARLPAPRPLLGPVALGNGLATLDEMRRGGRPDGRPADVRRAVAGGLRDLVVAASPLSGRVEVGAPLVLQEWGPRLWPEPHDLRFDFGATAAGAEWIDDLARAARRVLADLEPGGHIGHFDWRVGNLGFEGERIVAIYDWDSLARAPEAVIVGCAAAQFSVDWTNLDRHPLPTTSEMRRFVHDYETARAAPFAADERRALDAANLWKCAYGARCQHSDDVMASSSRRAPHTLWKRLLDERRGGLF